MAAIVKGCRVLERVPFLARNLSVSSARYAELAAKVGTCTGILILFYGAVFYR